MERSRIKVYLNDKRILTCRGSRLGNILTLELRQAVEKGKIEIQNGDGKIVNIEDTLYDPQRSYYPPHLLK